MNNSEDYYLKILFEKIKVKDIMTTQVYKLQVDDKLSKAAELFLTHRIFHLPVVDGQDKVVGLLSHKYLYRALSPNKKQSDEIGASPEILLDGDDSYYFRERLDSFILTAVMKKEPLLMTPEQTADSAVLHMLERKIGCIPVVDGDSRLSGIISHEEIIKLIGNVLKE